MPGTEILVRHLVSWYAEITENKKASETLYDILDTPISPSFSRGRRGNIAQKNEDVVGPYELHDFFLFICSETLCPREDLKLALLAFEEPMSARSF
jgi:NAD+ synthase (glutamine-hydrolysing)